jgi:hypothetical protein
MKHLFSFCNILRELLLCMINPLQQASRPRKTSVLVVGAGPVGLTLAMDLASRGIAVVVVEVRNAGEPPSVKCNHVSSRSMEVFRRLGVALKLRDAGLPADYPNDAPIAPRQRVSNSRASLFHAGATALPRRTDRIPAGRPPSLRTGSTRFIWSPCFLHMPLVSMV